MPPSAPSQSSPLAVSLPDDSAKPKAGMSDLFGATPISTHPPSLPSSSMYQDPYSSSIWNNGMMGAPSAMNSYPGMMYGGGLNTPFLSPMMMPNTGPFSNITNYLLGLQNVILSIGQVVQIISFNTHSLQHLCESILAMFEHAVRTWHEQLPPPSTGRTPEESEQQQQQRQRRIRALRYAAGVAFTYLGYTIVRAIRNRYRHSHARPLEYGPPPPPISYTPQYPPPTGPIPSYYNHASPSYPPSGMPPYHHPYQNQNHPYSGGPTW